MKTFFITKSNRIVDDSNTVVPMIETDPLYQQYLTFLRNNGNVELTDFEFEEDIKKQKLEAIKAKYELHKKNGWDAYQDFRAIIVNDIYEGVITEQQAFIIESNLKVAYDRIAQNGDWKTGYYELSQVSISNDFVRPYMDLALSYIQNYINKNYE